VVDESEITQIQIFVFPTYFGSAGMKLFGDTIKVLGYLNFSLHRRFILLIH
jgi:hypothetical protein